MGYGYGSPCESIPQTLTVFFWAEINRDETGRLKKGEVTPMIQWVNYLMSFLQKKKKHQGVFQKKRISVKCLTFFLFHSGFWKIFVGRCWQKTLRPPTEVRDLWNSAPGDRIVMYQMHFVYFERACYLRPGFSSLGHVCAPWLVVFVAKPLAKPINLCW